MDEYIRGCTIWVRPSSILWPATAAFWDWRTVDPNGKVLHHGREDTKDEATSVGRYHLHHQLEPGWEQVV